MSSSKLVDIGSVKWLCEYSFIGHTHTIQLVDILSLTMLYIDIERIFSEIKKAHFLRVLYKEMYSGEIEMCLPTH